MRVFLQQHPSATEPARYLQLTLQPDLFGGWELLRESGLVGGRAQLRRELFLQAEPAHRAFEKARDAQLQRGYQITYTSGVAPR
ncbi:WGR domain-containing protein [Stenotrophomonas sp.]|uniref:WGR domain-containing protein n=1 Tax=Stenotrophomonas sp. TaxID=69392 RepID=UPI0028A1AF56|nr:WGR domain-containing protein [Stenotrophomonas sp.]